VGARGPDGYQWPIPYLSPFSDVWQLTWSGQWALNAWPNLLLTGLLLALTGYLTWQRGYSPLEPISPRADHVLVSTLRDRFGTPRLMLDASVVKPMSSEWCGREPQTGAS
jgi:inner membrane protein